MVTEPNVEVITKDAYSIADVLASHRVFGVVPEDASPEEKADIERWISHEKEHFVGRVLRHVLDPYVLTELVLNYEDTGARLQLETKVWADTALFSYIKVTPAPSPNSPLTVDPQIDYEALKTDIQQALEYNLME